VEFVMIQLRRMLAPLTVLWLSCQILAVGLTYVALHAADGADATDIVCHCQHADGLCPMHKSPAGKARCAVRAEASGAPSVLTSCLGLLGLVPSIGVSSPPIQAAAWSNQPDSRLLECAAPPTPPPPRV
jgi:hypothetical protein